MYEGDSKNDEKLTILPKPERSDGAIQSPSKSCIPKVLSELLSFRKQKSHAEAGQELQDISRGSTSSDPPRRVQNFVEESTTEQSKPEEKPDPQQSSSSDPHSSTADSLRNGTSKWENQEQYQLDPSPSAPISLPNGSTSSEEHGPNPGGGWAYLSDLFRSIRSWSGRIMYGNESITHHILYGPPSVNRDDHPTTDILCGVIFVVVLLLVTVAVSKSQHKAWPVLPDTYNTYDEKENSRGGLKYTCGCILPPSLQTPENPTDDPNLNICYVPSNQETVTILMFPNSKVKAYIRDIISIYDLGTTTNITVGEGWNVTQVAHELTIWSGNTLDLAPFYPGDDTTSEPNAYILVDDLEGSNPPLSYFPGPPGPYIQMSWFYDCNDCNTCSLETVNNLSRHIVNESWVSCFYYGDGDHCEDGNHYNGKCVVYPPEALPVQFAVQKLLERFRKLPNIGNFRTKNNSTNTTTLKPDVLYLNSITATNFSKIQLSFLEIQKGSVAWTILLENFPSLETECANLSNVQVCENGTSLCNMYSDAISYTEHCHNFTHHSQCQPLLGNGTLNFTLDNESPGMPPFESILCPNITCHDVPPYLVTRTIPKSREKDALNRFVVASGLQYVSDENSGVCTKTYTNVIRHNPNPAAKVGNSDHSEDIFLESECVNATVDQSSFCWTTGRYHNFSDRPNDDWKRLSNDIWQTNGARFVCYRMEKQKFWDWFITFFGIMFGWYGTIVLAFFGLFGIWLLFRRRIIKFTDSVRKSIATAFLSVWDSCLGGTLGGSKSSVEQVPNSEIAVSSNPE